MQHDKFDSNQQTQLFLAKDSHYPTERYAAVLAAFLKGFACGHRYRYVKELAFLQRCCDNLRYI
jgi:hypothetical protein